jgi:glycosyltransferase involved in cell wall biosynthesis
VPWPKAAAKKIFVVSHGVDATAYRPARNGEVQSNQILFLNGLSQAKGIFTLLDAFELVAKSMPHARLAVAGRGSDAERVATLIASSPLRDRIDFMGHVPRERVPAVMAACALHCLPSFGDPYPGSILEAMACGKPVVATDAGGIPYLLPDDGGRRIPPGDVPALADALTEILASPQLQMDMGAVNRRAVEAQHTWERVGDRLEDIYRFVLRPSSSPRPVVGPTPIS